MTTVFIVSALGGQWEEAWEHPVKVVHTEERAKELVKELEEAEEKAREEAAEFIEKWRDSECLEDVSFAHFNCQGKVRLVKVCSDKCKSCQADHFEWRDNEWYRYVAVEMEDKA